MPFVTSDEKWNNRSTVHDTERRRKDDRKHSKSRFQLPGKRNFDLFSSWPFSRGGRNKVQGLPRDAKRRLSFLGTQSGAQLNFGSNPCFE